MTRVAAPQWASEPRTTRDNVADAAFQAIQNHREELLGVIHKAVEKYFNARGRFGVGDFPERAVMTGEYYLGRESYIGNPPTTAVRICIDCCCLRHPWLPDSEEKDDYVGLNVWVRWNPEKELFKWEASDLKAM
jgi:hypothetical protein